MTALYGTAIFQWSDHNLLPYSEDIDSWDLSGTPVVTAGEADPFGGTAAHLVEDDTAGAAEYVYDVPVSYTGNGQKALSLFIKEGDSAAAGGSALILLDTGVAANRALVTWTWSAGVPQLTYTTGAKLWTRPWLNGWYRIAVLPTSCTAANAHALRIYPAYTSAQVGDLRIFGATMQDVATVGGYVRTHGEALAWDGSAAQAHDLRVPLQKILPAGSIYRAVRESADRRVREVTTVGAGVSEITARIRYDEAPAQLNEMIAAGVAGHPLVYVPDNTDLDDAYELELIDPGENWAQQMEQDWVQFQETTLQVRLRRMDGGTLSGLFAA